MGYWRCKECGGEEFIELYRNGYKKYEEYDKNGEPVEDSLCDDDPELDIECEKCGNSGQYLKDIAEWIEEE